jgi:hypothetical protein
LREKVDAATAPSRPSTQTTVTPAKVTAALSRPAPRSSSARNDDATPIAATMSTPSPTAIEV